MVQTKNKTFVNFFLGGKDNFELFLGSRRVLKIGEGKRILEKAFTEANDLNPRFRSFKNKATPEPVRVKEIQTQHQIDLVNSSDMRVEYQETVYRYVLSVMDIFSRFHWLAPLERKKPSAIVPHLREIYSAHGPPKNLQSARD